LGKRKNSIPSTQTLQNHKELGKGKNIAAFAQTLLSSLNTKSLHPTKTILMKHVNEIPFSQTLLNSQVVGQKEKIYSLHPNTSKS
jgi:hypothetical protein